MWVRLGSSVCVDMYLSLPVHFMCVLMFGSVSIFFHVYHKCFGEFLTPIQQTDESDRNRGREGHQEKERERERLRDRHRGTGIEETRKERGSNRHAKKKRER